MIHVIYLVTCDLCGKIDAQARESYVWNDDDVEFPDGWEWNFPVPEKYRSHPCLSSCDACPECQLNPNWEKYND